MYSDNPVVIGQVEARRVLQAVKPAHVLLVAPPGMGKTHIAEWYAEQTVGDSYWWIMDGSEAVKTDLREIYMHHYDLTNYPGPIIVDEAQVVAGPEFFYPLLDKKPEQGPDWTRNYIFTTTDEGELPPALISRLKLVSLKPYSQGELSQIAGIESKRLTANVRQEIARLGHGSPRRVKFLADLIENIGMQHQRIIKPHEVVGIMKHLGYEQGLVSREVELLRALQGGARSIRTLSALMGTGSRTIRLWETGLVYAGLMTISSRGRELTEDGRRLLYQIDGVRQVGRVRSVR